MWMPTVTVPVPRPVTDRASSISVVAESSMEKACTSASGGRRLRRLQSRKARALWEVVKQEALPVELVGGVNGAGARGSSSGASSGTAGLSTTACTGVRCLVGLEQNFVELFANGLRAFTAPSSSPSCQSGPESAFSFRWLPGLAAGFLQELSEAALPARR